jgi:hypothetical protein
MPRTTRALAVLPAVTALALLAGCTHSSAAAGPASAPPTDSATTAAPTSNSEAPPAPLPGLGAVHKTSVFAITGPSTTTGPPAAPGAPAAPPTDHATVTITWHDERSLDLTDLLPACETQVTSAELGEGTVLTAVEAQVSATFHPAGASWPKNEPLTFTFSDGRQNQTTDRAYACFSTQNLDQPTMQSGFSLTPGAASLTVMWVRTGTGKVTGDDPDTYTVTETDKNGSCQASGGCTSRYGS